MSDLLLLTDRNVCPKCRRNSFRRHNGPCPNCGTMLFYHEAQFDKYEADGNSREWWFYHLEKGWMHRSQLMMTETPLARELPKTVVTPNVKTVTERIAEVKQSVKETARKILTKTKFKPIKKR